jgi:predicted O-methyltransferase YrrM
MNDLSWWNEKDFGTFMQSKALSFIMSLAKDKKVLEIGVWKGASTCAWIKGGAKEVYCVDHFLGAEESRDTWQKEAKEISIENVFWNNINKVNTDDVPVILLNGDCNNKKIIELAPDNYFDVLFIDGGHTYKQVKNDIKNYVPKLKKHGVILFDDCGTCHPQVKKAIKDSGLNIELVGEGRQAMGFCKEVFRE